MPVTVVVVDDSADIRQMLRLMLGRDERFELIGEATNGREGVDLAARAQPDLVILDRQMPVMGGLEAIPLIRSASPRTDIVLYTAGVEDDSQQAAIAAGAIGLLEKRTVALSLAEELTELLIDRWATEEAEVDVRLGPLPSPSASSWVRNSRQILEAVHGHPELVEIPMTEAGYQRFCGLLDTWEAVAADTDIFVWAGRMSPTTIQELVSEWARFDSMGDEVLAALGCHWSPPEAKPFFEALTTAVLQALDHHHETRRLAQALRGAGWPTLTAAGPGK